jgi:hypothetical protein
MLREYGLAPAGSGGRSTRIAHRIAGQKDLPASVDPSEASHPEAPDSQTHMQLR